MHVSVCIYQVRYITKLYLCHYHNAIHIMRLDFSYHLLMRLVGLFIEENTLYSTNRVTVNNIITLPY